MTIPNWVWAVLLISGMVWMVSSAYACPQEGFDPHYDIVHDRHMAKELYGTTNPFYRINGMSMEPTYHHGDIIVVNHTVSLHDIQLGDVVVFEGINHTIVHRAIYWNGTHWITIGDNNYVPKSDDVVGVDNLIGVVQGIYERVGNPDPSYASVIPQSIRALKYVGLEDCPYIEHPGLTRGWVGLNVRTGWYLVDDTLPPVLHRMILWQYGH